MSRLEQLVINYLKREEGITDLSQQEIDDNIKSGVDVYGSEEKLTTVLEEYLD